MTTPSSVPRQPEIATDPASIDVSYVPVLTDTVVFRKTTSGLRMAFDKATGVMFEFNETASSLLAKVDGKSSVQQLVAALCEEYEAPPEEITPDVTDLLARMIDAQIAVMRAP